MIRRRRKIIKSLIAAIGRPRAAPTDKEGHVRVFCGNSAKVRRLSTGVIVAVTAVLSMFALTGSASAATCQGPICGVDFRGVEGQSFTGPVGSFSIGSIQSCDPNTIGDVTIDWGDGTPTTSGTLVIDSCEVGVSMDGHIVGAHTYATSGEYTVTVTLLGFQGTGMASVRDALADLGITMAAPSTAKSGSVLVYVINVSNAGPDVATNVTMTDQLPYGTSFEAVTATGWACNTPAPGARGGAITCAAGSLPNGGVAASSIAVKIRARANRGVVTNAATVTSDTLDPVTSDNTASATTSITK